MKMAGFHVLVMIVVVYVAACKEEKHKKNVEQEHFRRSHFFNSGKPMYCLGPPGPPGPPGSQGVPGRDGRDGRDCPPCNCAGTAQTVPTVPTEPPVVIDMTNKHVPHHTCHHHAPAPPLTGAPCSGLGSIGNPAKSCDAILYSNPSAQSGTYWLEAVHGQPYQVHCEIISSTCAGGTDAGAWNLVARASGLSPDFAPNSPAWYDQNVINQDSSADITNPSSMKNAGWFTIAGNVIRVCYSGPRSNCANFSHNKGMTLSHLFTTQFAVQTTEAYTFEQLMTTFGKHLDLGHLKTEWCGINLGNLCNLAADPNKQPGTHICRIGCIGDTSVPRSTAGCNPDDYAIGIGVTSCNNPHGCHNTFGITKSLHFSSYPKHYGDYAQTAYIYVK